MEGRESTLSPVIARALLAAGLFAGLALSALAVRVQDAGDSLQPGVVARVGDQFILRDEWLRAVAAVASERRTPLSEADQAAILERLIDQSLLVQHGLALDLVGRDPRLRGMLVSEVMRITAEAQARVPTDEVLVRFYREHPDRFSAAPQLRVRAWRVSAEGGETPLQPALPDVLMPASRLQDWLGAPLTREALQLPLGEPVERLDAQGRALMLQVIERIDAQPAPYASVVERVRQEWQREQDEQAVRERLAQLRQQIGVVRAP